MNSSHVLKHLRGFVARYDSQKAAAKAMRVTLSYLNDVLHERREPGPKILKALGFRKGYERI